MLHLFQEVLTLTSFSLIKLEFVSALNLNMRKRITMKDFLQMQIKLDLANLMVEKQLVFCPDPSSL